MDLLQSLPDAAAADFAARLAVDLVAVTALVRGVYYSRYRRGDLFLTFFAFNLVVFLITRALAGAEMTLGAAFGLFAVFSMLRYRTEGISAKDMTYLFLVIALGLVMAIATGGWPVLLGIGVVLVGGTLLLESDALMRRELSQNVHYDNIKLVHAREREALLADLRERTGLDVHRVEVHEIDLLRDAARLTLYYHPPRPARAAEPARGERVRAMAVRGNAGAA
jgi:hypothetical protein